MSKTFHSVSNSVDPQKEAERETVAKHVAEWQAKHGAIPVIPLRLATAEDAVCKQAFTIGTRVMNVSNEARAKGGKAGKGRVKQQWKEGVV